MAEDDTENEVTLTLTGERAKHGVALSDFETFVDSFVSALRDYDRARRGEETRKTGVPERRASAASAFRLVRLEPGSAIATLVAERPSADDRAELALDDLPLALTNLGALARDIASSRHLPDDVVDALDRARRSCGEDGAIEVELPSSVVPALGPVRIDRDTIERLSVGVVRDEREVVSISGRLHSVNLEPDRLAIRSADGVEWLCRYDEALEPQILGLLGAVVWAEGHGRLTTPLRGTMRVARIEPTIQGRQTALFVEQRPPLDELLSQQGIHEPQGLDAVTDDAWVGDEADERYLAALSSDR